MLITKRSSDDGISKREAQQKSGTFGSEETYEELVVLLLRPGTRSMTPAYCSSKSGNVAHLVVFGPLRSSYTTTVEDRPCYYDNCYFFFDYYYATMLLETSAVSQESRRIGPFTS